MKALIILRATSDGPTGPDGEVIPSRVGGPAVPGGWDRIAEADGWFTLYPLGRAARPDVFLHALRLRDTTGAYMTRNSVGVFVLFGSAARLSVLKQAADPYAYTIGQIRAGGDTVKNYIRSNVHPEDVSATRMLRTMAGFDLPQAAEDTAPGDVT